MTTTHYTRAELARLIDHTLLKPEARASDVARLCDEGLEHGFYSVCVNPWWVPECVRRVGGSPVRVCTVAGFPLGATMPEQKAYEARLAVAAGASEIDMVANIGALRDGQRDVVVRDIAAVVDAAKSANPDALVKVIVETRALTEPEMILACRCVAEAQADFIKTSTGFHPAGGATAEHVAFLKRHIAPIRVKASGGIRDLATALAMLEAGADRLGMSAGVTVLAELDRQ